MRILTVVQGRYGERITANLQAARVPGWTVECWAAPRVLPPVIDYPEEYLPDELPSADLVLSLGYSHPIEVVPKEGISFEVQERNNVIVVSGYDKQVVGQTAAEIRAMRPVEPYKGKGIRYRGEYVRRKAGKAGKV